MPQGLTSSVERATSCALEPQGHSHNSRENILAPDEERPTDHVCMGCALWWRIGAATVPV